MQPFPARFFDREDRRPDEIFYRPDRMVTHIDAGAIAAVGLLYVELGVRSCVLDLMSSWCSHFTTMPEHLTVLGMNERELTLNEMAQQHIVHDLNADPVLPFEPGSFDDAVCCVSVDYLTDPVAVFREVARVLRPDGRFVITFSNRCFPTKAISGWLATDDAGRIRIVKRYFEVAGSYAPAVSAIRVPPGAGGDPLFAVWAAKA